MRTTTKFFILAGLLLTANLSAFGQSLFKTDISPQLNNPLPFSKGININTWLEPYESCRSGITHFGKQDLVNIKNMGADVVRIPIHFNEWTTENVNYTLDPLLFEVLDNIVEWSQEIKLYVILDCHNDGKTPTTPDIERFLSRIWAQVALRYRTMSKYVIYEIMNEPFGIDLATWGEIQGRVIKVIRQSDTNHSIIVGGADHNSVKGLLALPYYEDFGLIYSFHDYDPYIFTYQGVQWGNAPNLSHIPFPYDEKKMPILSTNSNNLEKRLYSTYRRDSEKMTLSIPLDKAVAFANGRRAPLLCGEFGAGIKYAHTKDRINWYKTMTSILDERKITRIHWSYTGDFGIFKLGTSNIFPKDLDVSVVHALGLDVPNYRIFTWEEDGRRSGVYSLYQSKFAQKVKASLSFDPEKPNPNLFKRDGKNGERAIHFPYFGKYDFIKFTFSNTCDFTSLYAKNACVEFYAKTTDPNVKFQLWFENSGIADRKWRATAYVIAQMLPANGQWHKISIPLADFIDSGTYDEVKKMYIQGQGKFTWSDIASFGIQNTNRALENGITIKDVIITY